jgi:hypothetical protein
VRSLPRIMEGGERTPPWFLSAHASVVLVRTFILNSCKLSVVSFIRHLTKILERQTIF